MKVKQIIEIDYSELEEIVTRYYNLPKNFYEFVAVQECGNDSDHSFSVTKIEPLSKYDQQAIDDLRKGILPVYCNYIIFQDLVNNSVLAPCEYLVKVSW
jgi:hypothetical protein